MNHLVSLITSVNCPSLDPVPADGMIVYSMDPALANGGYSINTTATYSCVTGQLFNGDTVRTCLNTGAWDGAEPECLGVYKCSLLCALHVRIYAYYLVLYSLETNA